MNLSLIARKGSQSRFTWFVATAAAVVLAGCQTDSSVRPAVAEAELVANSDDLLVVDCLLPGQIRKLGQNLTYMAPRRAVKTTGVDCEIRGGEYTAFDRADYSTALKIWLPAAQEGDADAQVYVGEIYEKGLGIRADYDVAQAWYRKAAGQGNTRAMINLGYLYESGLGVPRDLTEAMNWYRQASGLTDGELEFVSSVEMANRKAVQLEYTGLRNEVDTLRSQLAGAQRDLDRSRSALAQAEREVAGQSGVTAPTAVAASADNAVLARELEVAQSDRRRLLAELASAQADRQKQQATLTSQQGELEARKQALLKSEQALEDSRRRLAAATGVEKTADTQALQDELDVANKQLSRDRQELTRLTQELADSQLAQAGLLDQIGTRGRAYADLEERFSQLLQGNQDLERTQVLLAESRQERLRLTNALAEAQVEKQRLQQALPRLEAELAAREKALETTRLAAETLRSTQATAASSADEGRQELQVQLKQQQQVIAAGEAAIADLEKQLVDARRNNARGLSEAEQREAALREDLATRDKQIATLESELAPAIAQSQELQQARDQLDQADKQRRSLIDELATQKTAAADLSAQIEQLQQIAAARDLALVESRETITLLQDQLAENEQALAANSATIASLQQEVRQKTAEIDQQRRDVGQLEARQKQSNDEMSRRLAAAQDEQSRLRASAEQQQATITGLEQQLLATEASLAASQKRGERLAGVEGQLGVERERVAKQEAEIRRLLTKIAAAEEAATGPKLTSVVSTASDGPTIEIIEPPLAATRGAPSVLLRSASSAVEVIGRVSPEAGLLSFKINEQTRTLNANGIFRDKLKVASGETPVNVVAVDDRGNRTTLDFVIVPPSRSATTTRVAATQPAAPKRVRGNVDFGNYHALIIGNQAYQHMPKLKTPENDARELEYVLRSRYGFETKLLLDASRYEILSALNDLRASLTSKDNLLIFYAGHGELDNVNLRGHWLPVDAEAESSANWISNVAITDILNAMSAKHVLVIADSCYSGAMTRSSLARLETGMEPEEKNQWYEIMAEARARAVLSSGGLQPVLDSGGGDHSIFTAALLDVLRNNDGILEGYSLYRALQSRVKNEAARLNVEQDPQYAPIKFAGHEAGEFFFLPRDQRVGANVPPISDRIASR